MINWELYNRLNDNLKRIASVIKILTEEFDRFFLDANEVLKNIEKEKRKRGDK